jgi:hypothetical protein
VAELTDEPLYRDRVCGAAIDPRSPVRAAFSEASSVGWAISLAAFSAVVPGAYS